MKNDWRAGMAFVFDSFLRLLKAAFKSAIEMAIAGGKGIWAGVKAGIFGGKDEKAIDERVRKLASEYRKNLPPGSFYEGLGPLLHRTPLYYELRKQAEKEISKEKVHSILGDTMENVADSFKKAFSDILKDMPDDLRSSFNEAWQKHLEKLKELGAMPGPGGLLGARGKERAPKIFSMGGIENALEKIISRTKQGLQPLEARFLTFAPGTRFNLTEKNTNQTAKNTKMTVNEIIKLTKVAQVMAAALAQPVNAINLSVSNFT